MKNAAFELHKWHSNIAELESTETDQTADQTFAKQQLGTLSKEESSLLGLKWDKLRDFLSITMPTEKADNTKRGMLAKIARIYDSLEVASPLTLWGKLLYRDACNLRIGWDEQPSHQVGQMGIKITGENYIHEGPGSVSGTNQQHILTCLWRCNWCGCGSSSVHCHVATISCHTRHYDS